MTDNRISATLSQADQQAVLSAINTIRQKLPFLIDLSPEERHTLPKMGDKSRGFVSQALDLASLNSDGARVVKHFRRDAKLLTWNDRTRSIAVPEFPPRNSVNSYACSRSI